jgi:hypothetical protein
MRRRDLLELRTQVQTDAGFCCGYCRAPQGLVPNEFEMEHLRPVSRGGRTARENLWSACSTCNRRKSDRLSAVDPLTGRRVRFFNPRQQRWSRHFALDELGRIVGVTATGRATVEALGLNDPVRIGPRIVWIALGMFPSQSE